MARDYAKPAAAKKTQAKNRRLSLGRRTSPWVIFLSGAAVGVAATLAATLWRPHPAAPPAPTADAGPTPAGEAKPRFDFYTLLKESEVFVPEVTEPPLAKAVAPVDPTKKADGERSGEKPVEKPPPEKPPVEKIEPAEFVLQTGSFRARSDAESLRARLLLLNQKATIESAGAKPGEVWYRVMIGPFASQETLARARSALQQNGVDSIPVRRKKD